MLMYVEPKGLDNATINANNLPIDPLTGIASQEPNKGNLILGLTNPSMWAILIRSSNAPHQSHQGGILWIEHTSTMYKDMNL
ncbi:unnamed protein product [Dovyalis caffra]|uniref:Uncharacterized protein n=1 Tax=Dovyalis caffra TaxID=77055 RepID=A0AAV1RYP5_9ROSI|nr:unnamed protein product [Dovyalis caffra]